MSRNVQQEIETTIKTHPVVLYMKGTRSMPQCGFSAAVVACLREIGTPFTEVDVLADSDIRDGVKKFSDWPTIPQLYVGGEFVGGCDIVRQMHAKGELAETIQKASPAA
jgi:monothiol glutaredoxin